MKISTVFIIAFSLLIFGAAATFADDMWSETPDLNNLTTPSSISEPSKLSNEPPTIDMWAETPDLNNNNDTFYYHQEKAVVKSGLANSEMYAETPNLNKASPGKSILLSPEDVMVAEQEQKEMAQ